MSPERDVIDRERAAGAAPKAARESPALLARPPRLRLRQRRDAHAPGVVLVDDIVYNKRLAAALQRKLGGRRRRRWVEGDEALSQDAGFASIEAWVDAAAGRPPPQASPFACLRKKARAPAEDAAP